MSGSFRAFAEDLIDYAGMFPPASLSLEDSLGDYLRHRRGGDAWILGRFLCRTERLADLASLLRDFPLFPPGESPLRISAIGRAGAELSEFGESLLADLSAIEAFHGGMGARARVEALETRIADELPPDAASDRGWWPAHLPSESATIPEPAGAAGPSFRLWVEVGLSESWRNALPLAVESIAGRPQGDAGLKLRCGGVAASAFPSVEQVASVIIACARAGAPFKATAGLHHPVRSFRQEVGTKMHGFLNVFGAALLACEHRFDEPETIRILEEEDPAALTFTPGAFRWRERTISTSRIRDLRRIVTSFGSCSFDEPMDDLRELGIGNHPEQP